MRLGWPDAVTTKEQLLALGSFEPEWKEFVYDGMQLAVAVETLPTDSESYIDLVGYVLNRHFHEWRRFFVVQIRSAGGIEVRIDESGMLEALGTANNDLRGKRLFAFDLRAVYDDR